MGFKKKRQCKTRKVNKGTETKGEGRLREAVRGRALGRDKDWGKVGWDCDIKCA